MSNYLRFVATCLLLCHFDCFAADEGFSRQLLAESRRLLTKVGTNGPVDESIRAPYLLATDNLAPKLKGPKLDAIKLLPQVEIAGLRIGMKIDEVVALWGRPRRINIGPTYCLLAGTNPESCTHLCFSNESDCQLEVISETGGDRVITIRLGLTILEDKSSSRPGIEECIRALGEPTARSTWPVPPPVEAKTPSRYDSFLRYETPEVTLGLFFWGGNLSGVDANRRDNAPDRRNSRNDSRGPTNGLSQ
jgi:hypothetical protein